MKFLLRIAFVLSALLAVEVSLAAIDNPSALCFRNCQVDQSGYSLIKTMEGYSPFVYKDSVGVATIGFGHALLPGEKIKTPLMGDAALALLQHDVSKRTAVLNTMIDVPLSPDQYDAIADLAFNIGIGNFQRSTLLKRVNAAEHQKVPPQFLLWDKAGGQVLTGLRVRRQAEAMLYKEGIPQ